MTKHILDQYVDLKKELEEVSDRVTNLKKQIEKLEKDGVVADKVKGGLGGIQHYTIKGIPIPEYKKKKVLLNARLDRQNELLLKCECLINEVEKFISGIPDSQTRRIFMLRYVDGLSWNKVADKIGGGNTDDGVRKTAERYLKSCPICPKKI